VVKADPSLKTLLTQSIGNLHALNAEKCPSPSMPQVNGKPAPCQAWSSLSSTQQQEILAALQHYNCSAAQNEPDIPYSYYIGCDTTGTVAYLLGHVIVKGQQIGSAQAQAPNAGGVGGSVEWTVALKLHGSGADAWHAWTSAFHTDSSNQNTPSPVQTSTTPPCGASAALPCSTWVGFTLDGQVISLPITLAVLDVNTSISGNFTQSSANDLARELNYGKLPLNFRAEQNERVSATLGSTQLHAAFLAGGIGLALVIIYSFLYYRALGLVTIASLVVSGVLTYAMLVILSTQIGFTLDLAGIAGFIVALGITADSFVVFFERMKDEVHEGRSVRVAVPRAWVRARRTILSADTVSFLAAAILYYFASADVKGFAFTLGMSTILDLVVVFLFTHPIVSLLARSKAFGSPRFTGLASVRAGGIATSDDEPEPVRTRRGRLRRAVPAEPEAEAAVAVLDAEPETAEAESAPDQPPADEPPTGEPPPERRKTTPEPGSAAERAAARRARMREQGDGKEQR
jgi:preprotein translocase subunit SecD